MAESYTHKYLVEKGLLYSFNTLLKGKQFFSYCSLLDSGKNNFSPLFTLPSGERFNPDFYIKTLDNYIEVIGEAKTTKDIENNHTVNQLSAYINYANQTQCTVYIIIIVPFGNLGTVKSLLRNKVSKCNDDVIIEIKEF